MAWLPPTQVKESVVNNIKDMIDVPASYLEKANVPGPFLAGVNQVIPYEAFGGDGMLTRLLLKSSDKHLGLTMAQLKTQHSCRLKAWPKVNTSTK